MRSTILALTVLVGLGSASAFAQPKNDDTEAQTRLWDAMRNGKWRDALVAYNALEHRTDRQVFLAAQAHYNLGELEESALVLDGLLKAHDDHIEAIYMLARIRAKQGKLNEAKTLLSTSARLGQSVLRDLYAEEDGKLFKELLNDSNFLVSIMRDTQAAPALTPRRDPFLPPAAMRPDPDGNIEKVEPGTIADPERIAALEAKIKGLLREFSVLSRDPRPDIPLLMRKLSDLRGVLAEYAAIDDRSVRERLAKFRREFADMRNLIQPLQLQLYVADGNQHLRVMARGLRDEDYQGVLARFDRLEELVEQMQAEELSVFHANARSLFNRGKGLADRARILLKASELLLNITGVVLAPEPETSTAIINDRIYEEGDEIVDASTGDPIPGLRVTKIARHAVTFQLDELTFVRATRRR